MITKGEAMVSITFELPAAQEEAFSACWREWITNKTWEQRQALQRASDEQAVQSLAVIVDKALRSCYGTGGGRRLATILASIYNGDRVKASLYDVLGGLDGDLVEHSLQVMRLHGRGQREIHTYFNPGMPLHNPRLGADGNEVFERLIREYGLEKRRRKS